MIQVAPFAPEHTQGVIEVVLSIQQQEFNLPISLHAQPDLADIGSFYQMGSGNFWVALDTNRVVGTIGLRDIGNRQGALRKLFVAANYRGTTRGVANLLLCHLIDWANMRGLTDVYLGTSEHFRAAHRFYEKNQFNPIERIHLPPSFPVMSVDNRFYRRSLHNCAS